MRTIKTKKYMRPVEQVKTTNPPSWKSYLVPIGTTLATAGLAYAGLNTGKIQIKSYIPYEDYNN